MLTTFIKTQIITLTLCSVFLSQSSSATDAPSTQLQQLQQQLSQLQKQIDQQDKKNWAALDANNPLGALASPDLAYSLLQQQAQYPAMLTLGGSVSAAMQAWKGSELNGTIGRRLFYPSNGTAVAATTADLYVLANLTSWSQAFISVEGGLNGYPTQFSQAFVTVGDLTKTPFYATAGETYLPFGAFQGNGLVTNTLATNAFESTQLNQLDLGFGQDGLNTTLAVFNGASNFNDFVYSAQYTTTVKQWTFGGGAGYLYDLRYSGSSIAAAYNTSNGRTNIRSGTLQGGRNGAVDFNGNALYNFNSSQSLAGDAEWITTTNSPTTVRGISPGRMQAWTVAGTYTSPVLHKNTTFTLDYSANINMAAVPLQLPGPVDQQAVSIVGIKNQWLTDFQTEIMNNVYVGPEFAWINLANDQHTWETSASVSVYI